MKDKILYFWNKIMQAFVVASDKKAHLLAGAGIAALVGLPCYLDSLNLFTGLWAALWSAIIAGAIKEWCDVQYTERNWDWKDFAATCIGSVVSALFIIALHFGKG